MPSKADGAPRCPVCGGGRLHAYPAYEILLCEDCGTLTRTAEISGDAPRRWDTGNIPAERAKYSVYAQGLDRIERETAGRELLDVGAGSGVFMEFAAARGWKTVGVEPDRERAEEGVRRGHDIRIQLFGECRIDRRFDLVAFWDSLESIPGPLSTLKEAHRLLRPGGWVLLRARNGPLNFFVLRFVRPWVEWLIRDPAVMHRTAFGDCAVKTMFEAAGFEPAGIWNSAPTMGDPYGAGRGLGPAAVTILKFTVYAAAQTVAALTCGKLHLGNTLVAYARRPDDRDMVLHLITRLDPGGSAQSTWALANDESYPGIKIALASGNRAPGDGRPVFWLRHLVRNPSWRDLPALWEIYAMLRRLRPAILHTHSSKAGFLGRWAAWLAGVPVVHTPHGHVFYGYFGPLKTRFYWLLEKLCVPLTDHFVALTEGELRESVEFGIGKRDRWRIVPSGTPLEKDAPPPDKRALRKQLRLEEDAIWIGSLLRLDRVKGPDVFLEAAALLEEDGRLRFAALGDGPMRAQLAARARELGLKDRFLLAGHQRDIESWLGSLDIYVQPSRNEGMGRALIQAQAAGLPVVASDVCGIPDVVKDGQGGILVPPDDPAALANALRALAGDPAKREEMGRRGREWVFGEDELGLRRFSHETMQERLRRLYKEMLDEKGKAR